MNLYGFAGNEPVGRVDSLGMRPANCREAYERMQSWFGTVRDIPATSAGAGRDSAPGFSADLVTAELAGSISYNPDHPERGGLIIEVEVDCRPTGTDGGDAVSGHFYGVTPVLTGTGNDLLFAIAIDEMRGEWTRRIYRAGLYNSGYYGNKRPADYECPTCVCSYRARVASAVHSHPYKENPSDFMGRDPFGGDVNNETSESSWVVYEGKPATDDAGRMFKRSFRDGQIGGEERIEW